MTYGSMKRKFLTLEDGTLLDLSSIEHIYTESARESARDRDEDRVALCVTTRQGEYVVGIYSDGREDAAWARLLAAMDIETVSV